MATFIRPGTQQPSAFGVSYDIDRDRDRLGGGAPVYNKNEHLAVQDQRRRLPIYQHRTEILYLVETHATTVIVGETGSGKTTQIPQYLHEAGKCPSTGDATHQKPLALKTYACCKQIVFHIYMCHSMQLNLAQSVGTGAPGTHSTALAAGDASVNSASTPGSMTNH